MNPRKAALQAHAISSEKEVNPVKNVALIVFLVVLLAVLSCSSPNNATNAEKNYQPLDARSLTITIPIVQ